MNESTFRAFVGLPVPASVRHHLSELQSCFRRGGIRATWVAPENFHVTLRYLGNITYSQMDELDDTLKNTLGLCGSLHFAIDGTGVFPDMARPAVGWAGLTALSGDVDAVYAAADVGAATIGVPLETRPHHPHITLFRLRRGHAPLGRLEEILAETKWLPPDDFWVDSVALWKSELRRGGAVYQQLKEYPLQCLPSTC